MKMERVMIQLPTVLKRKLDTQRDEGVSISGFVRRLVARHFQQQTKKGR